MKVYKNLAAHRPSYGKWLGNPVNLVYVQLRKGLMLPRRGAIDNLHGWGAMHKVDDAIFVSGKCNYYTYTRCRFQSLFMFVPIPGEMIQFD